MDKVYHRIKGKTEHLKIVYNKTLKIYNKWKRGGSNFRPTKPFTRAEEEETKCQPHRLMDVK